MKLSGAVLTGFSAETVPTRRVPASCSQAVCSAYVRRFSSHYYDVCHRAHSCRTSLQGPAQLAHVAQISKQLCMATYYGTDMLIWLAQVGALRYEKE